VRAAAGEAGALSLTEPTEGTDFGVRDGVQGKELGNPMPAPTNARDVQLGAVGGMMAVASEDFCQLAAGTHWRRLHPGSSMRELGRPPKTVTGLPTYIIYR
jgi:hypothetical protein